MSSIGNSQSLIRRELEVERKRDGRKVAVQRGWHAHQRLRGHQERPRRTGKDIVKLGFTRVLMEMTGPSVEKVSYQASIERILADTSRRIKYVCKIKN